MVVLEKDVVEGIGVGIQLRTGKNGVSWRPVAQSIRKILMIETITFHPVIDTFAIVISLFLYLVIFDEFKRIRRYFQEKRENKDESR